MGLMTRATTLMLLVLQIFFCFVFVSVLCLHATADEGEEFGVRVTRDQRRSIVKTDYGEISAADVSDGSRQYHLQFFTLEPNALFLPAILHGEMVLYCHSGSGNLLWIDHNKRQLNVSLVRGDVYRVRPGSAFYMESNVDEGLGISAIFATSDDDLHAPSIGAYSSISDMVRGFDTSILQSAFKVPEEVIETIKNATRQQPIIQNVARESSRPFRDWETRFMETIMGINGYTMASSMENKKKEKGGRTFNVYRGDRDVENCNGWSLTVTRKELHAFDDSRFGVFYVNLSTGAMMGPHWNPLATEIALVVAGQGMVRSVCPSTGDAIECENTRFRVKEGDIFVVPRYRPMAQMSFNNESFVFVGFSTRNRNYPQYLAGKASVLQVIDKKVLSAAFNVDNATMQQLLAPQKDAIILECTSCAEGEYRKLEEDMERRRQEEEAREREEEEKRREEEEEEETKRREEERQRREKEQKQREEEERRKREEEEEQRKQEEEAAREEEEERARREEQERQEREEEVERREQEEEQRRQQEKEQEEQARREREREEQERQEQEEAAEREEEEARKEEQERQQHEEAARREQEEEQRRQQEEQEREEQERQQREAAARKQEERQRRQQQEEEQQRREEEEREHGEEERTPGGGGGGESEEEIARRQEEERQRREREQGGGDGGETVRLMKKIWKI